MKIEVNYTGSTWVDITAYIEKSSFQRTLKLHRNLNPTINTLSCKIKGTNSLINSIISANTVYIRAFEDDEVTPYFYGTIEDEYKIKIEHRLDGLEVQCVDLAWMLKAELEDSVAHDGYYVYNSSNPSQSLVHLLIGETDYPTAFIDSLDYAYTIDYFYVEAGESVEDILKDLLGEFGLIYNVEVDGTFTVYPFAPDSITSSGSLDNSDNLIGTLEIKKNEAQAKSVTVNYRPVILETDRIVASDTTGATDTYKCNIEVEASGYYPEDSDSEDVEIDFNYNDKDLIRIESATLDLEGQTGISAYKFSSSALAAIISIRNTNTVYSRYIRKLDIRGNVYYYGDYNSEYVHNGANTTEEEEIDAVYIQTSEDALRCAQLRANYFKYATHTYSGKSKDQFSLGDFISLIDTTLGLSTTVQIVEIKDKADGYYNYEMVAVSAYEVLPDTESTRKHTTNGSSQETVVAGDVLSDVASGYDLDEEDSEGVVIATTTPAQPVIACTPVSGGIRITADKQKNLTNFSHYSFQVSEDEVSWYALGMDGTDWKTGSAGGATSYEGESLLHLNMPSIQLAVSGNTTLDSAVITGIADTSQLSAGDAISGSGIPSGATIESVDSSSQITLSAAATATAEAVTLTIGDDISGSGSNKKYMGVILSYRVARVTKAAAVSAWSDVGSAQAGQVKAGDIPANTILANQLIANFIEAGFAKVNYGLTIGYAGVGTVDDPEEGDRRIYLDEDEITFQQYINGAWTWDKSIKIGGSELDGLLNPVLMAKGLFDPEVTDFIDPDFPGGDLWYFDGNLLSQNDSEITATNEDELYYDSDSKFGGFSLRKSTGGSHVNSYLTYPGMSSLSFENSIFFGAYVKILDFKDVTTYLLNAGGSTDNLYIKLGDDGLFYAGILNLSGSVTSGLTPGDGYNYVAVYYEVIDASNSRITLIVNGSESSVEFATPTMTTPVIFDTGLFNSSSALYAEFQLDETHIALDTEIDLDVIRKHVSNGFPWNHIKSSDNIIFKPKAGGKILLQGPVVYESLTDEEGTGVIPVGFIYFQLPGKDDPYTLGLPGTWDDVSDEFPGDFFRVKGGNALSFNGGRQGSQNISHTHTIPYWASDGSSNVIYGFGFTNQTSSNYYYATHYFASGGQGGTEARSQNQTIVVWERVA